MIKVQTNVNSKIKERLTGILNNLGLTEAEYLRGALLARMRRDTRAEGKRQIGSDDTKK